MQNRRKQNAALVSVGSNTLLVVSKAVIGISIGSVSVISEALHSSMDLLAATIALWAVRTSAKPADEDHPFGHGKWESVSGTIEALLILIAAVWIVWEAIKKLLYPQEQELAAALGAGIMLVSAVMNFFVSRMLFRVAHDTESPALEADAWHLRTDVWTSVGVTAGLGVIWLGKALVPGVNLQWLDPVAALAVAVLIGRAAWTLTVRAGRDLLDVRLPEMDHWIREYLEAQPPPIRGFHHLRTRKSGSTRLVEFHLWLEPELSVAQSHALGDEVVGAIKAEYPDSRVIVHVEPYHEPELEPHE